ncbi:MAG: DUF192 domain-containing protein [Betaproteobacteria bacterium]|nr:DUF192 domain-containing protein [Betaproteobacteria bacterium]
MTPLSFRRFARDFFAALAFSGLALATGQVAAQGPLPTLTLTVEGHAVKAEVAATVESRTKGLMHREKLGKNDGMLFVFDELGYHAMWMKNTLIPLAVAFIDEQGKILNIAEMQPHSESTHAATGPARYALEMNAGWFKERNVGPGTKIKGLDKAPKGR